MRRTSLVLIVISMFLIGILIGLLVVSLTSAMTLTQNATVVLSAGEINVFSPENKIYTHRIININITLSGNAGYLFYTDNNGKLKLLCKNCNEYGYSRRKIKSFKDGFHEVVFLAIFGSGNIYEYVNFTVDTKSPRILKTKPKRGFSNGSFEVEFREANPVNLSFNFGNEDVGFREKELNLDECFEKSKTRKCEFSVNLSDYNGQKIQYYSSLTDIVGGYEESKLRKLDIDVSSPVINSFNYSIEGRRVNFVFNVSEPNFHRINFIDYRSNNPKWRKLCSRLKKGICEKKKSFKKGFHNVSIRVIDDAGNSADINNVIFKID